MACYQGKGERTSRDKSAVRLFAPSVGTDLSRRRAGWAVLSLFERLRRDA